MIPEKETGIAIRYNIYESLFGETLIASTDKGICFLSFGEKKMMEEELKQRFPGADPVEEKAEIHSTALSLLSGSDSNLSIPLHIKGTDFQLKVWDELLLIPFGHKSSYKQIAENIGKPKAVRAVGSAVGKNPVSCLIPCHRVIRSDNALGGYHWGPELKERMLQYESKNNFL
ncbi:MAG: methylated-DNA--[protein]-cysteine S-methyltransferase [Proteiniphilum sp.]|nr:methylated-DNA--[protein]-cysteine S-methyltransferase [Proteiniphilum sp.]